ncbi:MAG: galactose-1-phosphate uridylyltransferase, partial [Eubacterium sp.]|nr:galactose-1-phosphate uridylyltransferase [Eubacterium sp.]
ENIGLIEVMGLAILPARLKTELALIHDMIAEYGNDTAKLGAALRANEKTASHADWVLSVLASDPVEESYDITAFLHDEVGKVFSKVLECAGIYKCNEEGRNAFMRFIKSL